MLLTRCAHEAAPTGGSKDTQAPKLIGAFPLNESRNFRGKTITMKFDEYLNYSLNPAEIQVTPEMNPAPKYYVSGKTLIVQLPKTLDTNITYNIEFGDAIKDINEGNILHDATFCFSTGDSLDIGYISGSVIALKDLRPVESVMVGIYKDTGAFAKPIYFTNTDENGVFIFHNVKKGNYRIAAFEDKNINRQYDAGDGQSGFIDGTFALQDSIRDVQLNLFPQYKGKIIDDKLFAKNKIRLAFHYAVSDWKMSVSPPNEIEFSQLNDSRDTLYYWYKNTSTDSLHFSFINGDSLSEFTIKNKIENDTLRFADKDLQPISPLADFEITFSNPLKTVDKNRFFITEDSITQISSDSVSVKMDGTKLKISFAKKPTKNYVFSFQDSCVTDIFGYTNLKQKVKATVARESDFANLILKKSANDSHILLIELLNTNGTVVARKTLSPEQQTIAFMQLPKGSYTALGTFDDNNNGYWDGGNLEKGTQPEKRIVLKDGIELKGGWEVEAEIDFSGKQTLQKRKAAVSTNTANTKQRP